VIHRQKDNAEQIAHLKQAHRLRLVITELAQLLPEDVRASEAAIELENYGCVTRMHVVRLLAPRLDNENLAVCVLDPDGDVVRYVRCGN
jgi:NTE family protein